MTAADGHYEGPLWAPASPSGTVSEQRLLRTILQAIVRQATYDEEAEDAKAWLRPGAGMCGLPAFFKVLDGAGKGYVLDTDLLQIMKDHETSASFASLCALIHEADIRRGGGITGRLCFRDIGKMVFPADSKEYRAMVEALNDNEAKSVLYLLRFTEPCPRCGMRIQRDKESDVCPNVVCSSCKAPFRCFTVGRPSLDDGIVASAADRFSLQKLVAAAARTAENLEMDRKRLAALPGFDSTTLETVYNYISSGRKFFDFGDLREALRDQHVPASEKELDLIWHRYAPGFGEGVSKEGFVRHLRYEPTWTPEMNTATNRLLKQVLQTVMRQAVADCGAEDAKAFIPKGCPLTALFRCLDPMDKGYLIDTDLFQIVQDFRGKSSFASLCALVQEIQLRRRYDQIVAPGRLGFREFGTLIFRQGSKEYEALRKCCNDAEAKSTLYLLSNSEPCPGCGLRVQRDSESAGCPEVTCPKCKTSFRALCVVGDRTAIRQSFEDESGASRLSVEARSQLHRTIAAAAQAAEELEKDRFRLAQLLGYDATALSDVFNFVAQGRSNFTLPDLRRALTHMEIKASEKELDMVWKRYAPHGGATVAFHDFMRQLKPLTQGLGGP